MEINYSLKMVRGIFAVLLICVVSCNGNIDYQTSEVIQVPLEQGKISVIENFEEVNYLNLKGNGGLFPSKIDQLEFIDDEIFILDKSFGVIFKFSSDGQLVAQLEKLGEGPEEYQYLHRFIVDEDNGTIEVYDKVGQKIIVYDRNFNFIESFRIDLFFQDFVKLGEKKYLFYLAQENYFQNEVLNENLVVWDKGNLDSRSIKRFPTDRLSQRKVMAKSTSSDVTKSDLIYVSQSYNDTLYVFSKAENSLTGKVLVDFGAHKLDITGDREFLTVDDVRRNNLGQTYSCQIDDLFVTENFISFTYIHNENGGLYSNDFYYFPKSGKTLAGNGLRNDIDGFNLVNNLQTKGEFLVTHLSSEYLSVLDFDKASPELNRVMDFDSSFEDQLVLVFLKFKKSLTGEDGS